MAKAELVEALPADRPGRPQRRRPRRARHGRAAPRPGSSSSGPVPTPQVRAERRHASTTPGRPTLPGDHAGRRAPRCRSPLHGEHHVGNALAVRRGGARVRARPSTDVVRGPGHRDARLPLADGGHRAPRRRDRRQRRLQRQPRLDARRPQGARGHGWRRGARPAAATWAVLGSMLELGDDSTAEHDAIGRLAVRLNISRLVVVGRHRAADGRRAPSTRARGATRPSGCPTRTPPTPCSPKNFGPVTSCCSSPAATPDYGGSETDWSPRTRRRRHHGRAADSEEDAT